ncbi:flagellar hook-basal body complex protein FliE [Aciditerrimonas ferrireducens]|jgi:flagellar hook-basal body complex protein FliE|uniref:Flagellar hook-basal body complex protein FliE n=1 Tax=Aciditerrimonas ferrireducens TaxID=667306 RepID=A0ABV6C0R6_9ACTN|nr:flagellar hook-basal body complex protein FliE [Aciditerrimonas ferrireducens]MCK4177614.1 flagellar hook-basal body complex protein FliE [Aciditerrimonas ferrireducens]
MIPPIQPLPGTPAPGATGGTIATGSVGGDFGQRVASALDHLQGVQNGASALEAQAAAGQGSISNAMIAASEASLDTQVTVALANKAIAAFTDVMNLQV